MMVNADNPLCTYGALVQDSSVISSLGLVSTYISVMATVNRCDVWEDGRCSILSL